MHVVPLDHRAQEQIALVQPQLRVGRVEVDVYEDRARAARARDAIHAAQVHHEVGVVEGRPRSLRRGAEMAVGARVPEGPRVGESVRREECACVAHAVRVVVRLHRRRARHIGVCVVGAVLVEEDVAVEGAEASEKVQRLPGVAPERIAHQVAGDDDARAHRRHPSPASASRRRSTVPASNAPAATSRAAAQRRPYFCSTAASPAAASSTSRNGTIASPIG